MTLRAYQTEIDLDTLYEVRKLTTGSEQLAPNIFIEGGSADVYVSNADAPASAPTGMNIIEGGENLSGVALFAVIPSYLYVTENTATVARVVLSGVEAVEVE